MIRITRNSYSRHTATATKNARKVRATRFNKPLTKKYFFEYELI